MIFLNDELKLLLNSNKSILHINNHIVNFEI